MLSNNMQMLKRLVTKRQTEPIQPNSKENSIDANKTNEKLAETARYLNGVQWKCRIIKAPSVWAKWHAVEWRRETTWHKKIWDYFIVGAHNAHIWFIFICSEPEHVSNSMLCRQLFSFSIAIWLFRAAPARKATARAVAVRVSKFLKSAR